MKKVLSVCLIIFILLISNMCFATDLRTIDVGNTVSQNDTTNNINDENGIMPISEEDGIMPISDNPMIDDDIYRIENNISINEDINGNVYLIGNSINVSSYIVNGNIFAIGNNVVIDANVIGSVYVMGNSVEINGSIYDAYVMCDNLKIGENASCRDVRVGSDNLEINGVISRNLYSASDKVNISELESAVVNGTLFYSGNLSGDTNKIGALEKFEDPFERDEQLEKELIKASKMFSSVTLLFTTVIILAIIIICTKKQEKYLTDIKEKFISDTLYGLLYAVVLPIIMIILVFTVVGIPLGLILLILYIMMFAIINLPVASIEIAKFALQDRATSKALIYASSIIVFILIKLVGMIPYIGGIVKFIISLYGLGFIIRKLFRNKTKKSNNEEKQEVITEKVD